VYRYSEPPSASCVVQHNIGELRNATINFGERGSIGPVLYEFDVSQGWTLVKYFEFDVASLENLLDGLWYIQLSSLDFPDGEIRGQIEHRDRFYSILTPQNTIPRSSGTDAHGIALGSYDYQRNSLIFDLVHDVTSAQSTNLGMAPLGRVGPIIDTFEGDSPIFPIAITSASETANLFSDSLYLDIRSRSNPRGDIRGQFITIDYIHAGWTALFPGDGAALLSYNCDTRMLEYVIVHDISANGGDLRTDSTNYPLPGRAQSPLYGSQLLSPENEEDLFDDRLQLRINGSPASIEATVNDNIEYYAYLSGTNVVPPITSRFVGILQLEDTDSYQLFHNVPDVTAIVIVAGEEGVNTPRELAYLE